MVRIKKVRTRRAALRPSRIRLERLNLSLTLNELALLSRIPTSTLSLAERGISTLRPELEERRRSVIEAIRESEA